MVSRAFSGRRKRVRPKTGSKNVLSVASDRFVCKRTVFQLEPVSRVKQRASFRQSLNYWKCKGYFESSLAFALHFTIPAGLEMNEGSAGPANGRHSQVGTCEASRTSFVRQFRLQGDSGGQRKQRSEASAIRETVPTPR